MTDVWIKQSTWWVPVPGVLAVDWGLVDPDNPLPPEPTPIEEALGILAPHLADEPLYRA